MSASIDLDLVGLEGGEFTMGTDGDYGYMIDGEGPAHAVELSPFAICRHAVTNEQFATFVEAAGHRTEAERCGASFVFAGFLPEEPAPTRAAAAAPWWRLVEGADWAHPEGPRSGWRERPDHPVVHVSWNDAIAFCRVERHATADRGRVGVRRARRPRRLPLPLGRGAGARRRAPDERLPGNLSRATTSAPTATRERRP